MKDKERVIVIDLVGEDGQSVVKTGGAGGHECRCGVCTCHDRHEPEQLELQLQMHEFAAPACRGAEKSVLPEVLPEFGELVRKFLSRN